MGCLLYCCQPRGDWVGLLHVCSEDQEFLEHEGFDFNAIKKAYKYNQTHKKKRGASTISQQTAKNVFLWETRSWLRKGLEVYFTFLIELIWSKERIMEVYLNIAETGIGTYGVNAGSQRYFGHDADQMTSVEAARIAAILPLPKKRDAAAPKGYTRKYGNRIKARTGAVKRDALDACLAK